MRLLFCLLLLFAFACNSAGPSPKPESVGASKPVSKKLVPLPRTDLPYVAIGAVAKVNGAQIEPSEFHLQSRLAAGRALRKVFTTKETVTIEDVEPVADVLHKTINERLLMDAGKPFRDAVPKETVDQTFEYATAHGGWTFSRLPPKEAVKKKKQRLQDVEMTESEYRIHLRHQLAKQKFIESVTTIPANLIEKARLDFGKKEKPEELFIRALGFEIPKNASKKEIKALKKKLEAVRQKIIAGKTTFEDAAKSGLAEDPYEGTVRFANASWYGTENIPVEGEISEVFERSDKQIFFVKTTKFLPARAYTETELEKKIAENAFSGIAEDATAKAVEKLRKQAAIVLFKDAIVTNKKYRKPTREK